MIHKFMNNTANVLMLQLFNLNLKIFKSNALDENIFSKGRETLFSSNRNISFLAKLYNS